MKLATALPFLFSLAWIGFASADAGFKPPASGPLTVAFVVSEGANVIDFSGPWEVFQDTSRPGTEESGFRLFTVSEARLPITLTGGLKIVPDYTFADAPPADIVVVGANGRSEAMIPWLRKVGADPNTTVMSVCTGAFKVAAAGLFDGKRATTHHDFLDAFARRFPKVELDRGARYVQSGPHLFSAGGLTSGIDLALHMVERYYGPDAAKATAAYMEYRRATP
ncbi:MAG TPA: DJ-1/PfpI family protein [Usitatibacter sp.]|jgi:transcriptional regulator GlxA family with amidase domain|nr:DJ-1/PfpI family protein [Usitatibacter sp.]